MRTKNKHRRILILMVISQLLLICFALYWLGSQYKLEKSTLLKNLYTYYKQSTNVTIDSMLLKHYIEPAMNDSIAQIYSNGHRSRTVVMADSFKITDGFMPVRKSDEEGKGIVTIRVGSSPEDSSAISEFHAEAMGPDNEMLLRGVKLFVQLSSDSANIYTNLSHGFKDGLDSALFVSDFESRLSENQNNLSPIWISAFDDSAETTRKSKFVIRNHSSYSLPNLSIRNYRVYIFGQIFPQILFVLILIILTASAFILAYRNIIKQVRLNEMRNSFISNISHELKTPVSTVKVALEALRNFDVKSDPELTEEYLVMAGKEIKRLELLISKVLDHSVIEQDSSILQFEEVDLPVLIKEAIDSLRHRIDEAEAKVDFSGPESLVLNADPLYLQGVLINLFDNSLKYGNGNPEIEISVSQSNSFARIIISDNGPGIPDEYTGKVFEKFFRVPSDNLHNVKGYGLGLSFAALIVEMHKGSIDVNNNKKGCSFIIKIPIERVE